MNLLPPVGFGGVMFNVVDNQKFQQAMQLLRESLFDKGATSAMARWRWGRRMSKRSMMLSRLCLKCCG